MMVRLLQLKKPIIEYFKRHPTNTRKLTTNEWTITNQVCSLLDVVAEVTIKIQGGADTHIGQTMFNMLEIKEIFSESEHNIRILDQPYDSSGEISKELVELDDLSEEARLVREVMLSRLEKKELGKARMPVERICALLDPRRKDCSDMHLINGGADLKASAVEDVKNVAKTFVEPNSSAAGAGEAGGVGGPIGAGGGDGSTPPAPKRPKVVSHLEQRRRDRLAKAKASTSSSSASPAATAAARRSAVIAKELRMYLAEDAMPEEDDFSLLKFWQRRSAGSTCAETGAVEAGLPHLALIARLYNGIESTSCQTERNFSALSFLIGSLRSQISPNKVERLMFLRLNRLFIPEVKALHDAVEAKNAAADQCQKKVAQVEGEMADKTVTLSL